MLAIAIFAALSAALAYWGGAFKSAAPMFNTDPAILAIDAAYAAAANGMEG